MKELYKYFKQNGRVVDITDYDPHTLDIDAREVYQQIINGDSGWEDKLPENTAKLIHDKKLFQGNKI